MTTHCTECGWCSAGPHIVHELDCSQYDAEKAEAMRGVDGINCCRPVHPPAPNYFTVHDARIEMEDCSAWPQ